MSRKPYIATTALPTLPARSYNDWAEHIHNTLREGYPAKRVSAAVDREDNTVCFYNADGDEIRRESLTRIMDGCCIERDDWGGTNNMDSRYVYWQDVTTDEFRDLAEGQVKWWAEQHHLAVDYVEFC